MTRTLRRAALATAAVLLAPASALLPGMTSDAHAGTYVSGHVTVAPSPNVVLGFSFGDPYVYGHVHHSPGYCSHGPLYYYPAHDVYTHYVPRYRYTRYDEPYHHEHRYRYHNHASYRHSGHRHSKSCWADNGRHRGYGKGKGHYRDDRDDRHGDYRKGRSGKHHDRHDD